MHTFGCSSVAASGCSVTAGCSSVVTSGLASSDMVDYKFCVCVGGRGEREGGKRERERERKRERQREWRERINDLMNTLTPTKECSQH